MILDKNAKMADKALRVLAVTYLDIERLPSRIETDTIEQNLIFVGLVRNDRSSKRWCKKSNKYM